MKKYLSIMGLTLLLSACFGGQTPPAQFYTLMNDVSNITSHQAHFLLGVERVRIPQSLERPQMITSKPDSPDIHVSEMNRWVEPLNALIQRTLILDLGTALPNAEVRQRNFSRNTFTYILSVDVVQLEAFLGDKVSLLAWATIQDASGHVISRIKIQESVAIGPSYTDMARGQSILIGRMAEKIAGSLIKETNK